MHCCRGPGAVRGSTHGGLFPRLYRCTSGGFKHCGPVLLGRGGSASEVFVPVHWWMRALASEPGCRGGQTPPRLGACLSEGGVRPGVSAKADGGLTEASFRRRSAAPRLRGDDRGCLSEGALSSGSRVERSESPRQRSPACSYGQRLPKSVSKDPIQSSDIPR